MIFSSVVPATELHATAAAGCARIHLSEKTRTMCSCSRLARVRASVPRLGRHLERHLAIERDSRARNTVQRAPAPRISRIEIADLLARAGSSPPARVAWGPLPAGRDRGPEGRDEVGPSGGSFPGPRWEWASGVHFRRRLGGMILRLRQVRRALSPPARRASYVHVARRASRPPLLGGQTPAPRLI